jgi:hypothetical protein
MKTFVGKMYLYFSVFGTIKNFGRTENISIPLSHVK